MRRITMEFDYQKAWKWIFGSNSEKVEVLEALRCFKCDTQGLAIICIEGRSCVPKPPKDIKPPNMLMARPPDFLDVDRMKVEMIGKENEIKKLVHCANKWGDNSFKIL